MSESIFPKKFEQHSILDHREELFWCYSALAQAGDLSKDAKHLYAKKRFGSSVHLTVLAMEEFAKCFMLLEFMGGVRSQENWHQLKRRIFLHNEKINFFINKLLEMTKRFNPESTNKFQTLLHQIKEKNIDLVELIKTVREGSIYTSAHADQVITPSRLSGFAHVFIPAFAEIVETLSSIYLEGVAKLFPKLTAAMRQLSCASSDEEYAAARSTFDIEAARFEYLIKFIKSYFKDWQATLIRIGRDSDFESVTNIIHDSEFKREIKIGFELLFKSDVTDEQRWGILVDPSLSEKAKLAYGIALKSGMLKTPQ
jgi:AbiV family abortive infection protein